jgi:hypothetical protein
MTAAVSQIGLMLIQPEAPLAAGISFATAKLVAQLNQLSAGEKITALNYIRRELHRVSPFAAEPVDCIQWVPLNNVVANDYNPNSVAPPEMELLRHSIAQDGYTQPIVAWRREDEMLEVVDGFHRNRVGRECADVRERIRGHLPLAIVNQERHDRGDRIAATIRHNRARGKHRVEAMSDIVLELKRRNWTDEKIGRELGMDPDEVLRLTQITGLAEMFTDQAFSKAWDLDTADESIVLSESGDIASDDDGAGAE